MEKKKQQLPSCRLDKQWREGIWGGGRVQCHIPQKHHQRGRSLILPSYAVQLTLLSSLNDQDLADYFCQRTTTENSSTEDGHFSLGHEACAHKQVNEVITPLPCSLSRTFLFAPRTFLQEHLPSLSPSLVGSRGSESHLWEGQNRGKGPKMSRGHQQTINTALGLLISQQSVEPEVPCGFIPSWNVQHLLSLYRLGDADTNMKR